MFKFANKQSVRLKDHAIKEIYSQTGKVVDAVGFIMAIKVARDFGNVYDVAFDCKKTQQVFFATVRESVLEDATPVDAETESVKDAAKFDRNSIDYLTGALHAYQAMQDITDAVGVLTPELSEAIKGVNINLNKAYAKRDAEKVTADIENEYAKKMVGDFVRSLDPQLGDAFDKIANSTFLNDIAKKL